MSTRTIAIANQKGGVGKTSLTLNLSWLLAQAGRKVLALDLDSQRNLTKGWNVADADVAGRTVYDVFCWTVPIAEAVVPIGGTGDQDLAHDLVPGSQIMNGLQAAIGNQPERERRLVRQLKPVLERYDYVFLDCPPEFGLATLNALYAATDVLIPVRPEQWPTETTIDFFENIDRLRNEYLPDLRILGIAPNECELGTTQHRKGLEFLSQLAEAWKVQLFRPIPKNTAIRDATSAHKALSAFNRGVDAALAMESLAQAIDAQYQAA
jgi:chromosome partitioning protein